MRHPVMEHTDAAEKNARELIHLMKRMINDLKTDRMYYSFRAVDVMELVGKVQEYNANVNIIKGLCKEA